MTGAPPSPSTPGQPRLLIYIVIAVIVIAIAGAVVTSNNDDGPSSSSSNNPAAPAVDSRQQLYNAFFRQARTDLASTGPELFCDPDYWLLVADNVTGATGGDKAILQLAMGDACKEAGHLSGAAQFSAYYADR